MNSMIKKIVAVMAAVVMAVTAAVSVSADFTNVDDYGFYYSTYGSPYSATRVNLGDSIPLSNPYSARWAVSGLQPDYTYDIFLDLIFDGNIDKSKVSIEENPVYYSLNRPNLFGFINNSSHDGWILIENMNGAIEYKSDSHITIHLIYNFSMSGLNYSTIQFALLLGSYSGGFNTVKAISQGVGAYYDPGGDTYTQLIYEYGAGNPLPDVKDIKDQGAAMSTAEAAVRDKSSDLASSVDSEWTGYQSDAKALATTLKPAATQINNLYATITAELPDEVKALFIAIPILLFIGWLIGRVRE